MNKPVLVVMAAGMGSRYGGMKQIDPVGPCGQVIVDYSLYDARRAGFETVIFVIKHEIEEAFKAAIGDRVSRVMDVKYAFQQLDELPEGYTIPEGRVKPWGTCHAVLAAKPYIHGPFAVINADDYYGPEAFKVIYDYLSTHTDGEVYDYCMVSYLLKNTVSENGSVARGVCALNEDSTLHSVTERTRIETYKDGIHYTEDGGESWTDLPGETPVSMNLWGFGESFVKEADRRFARCHLHDQTFIIKAPQIFHRATTAANDDDVAVSPFVQRFQRTNQRKWCIFSLHQCGSKHHLCHRAAPGEDIDDILKGCSCFGGHHADSLRKGWNRFFPCFIK